VQYTTLGNDRMKFTFPDRRVLNGKPVDLSKTPLFGGPYLHAAVGSQKLLVTYGKQKLDLDFRKLTITK
jgi:hypothetical protein